MFLDKLIAEISKDLSKKKNPQERVVLHHQLNRLMNTVAINVKTKKEADGILETYKEKLYKFPYPFGAYTSWVEIGDINYLVMPPDDKWPHYQIYFGHYYTGALYIQDTFLWSRDGRIGPHIDRRGGFPVGPAVYAYQNGARCDELKNTTDFDIEVVSDDGITCDKWRNAYEDENRDEQGPVFKLYNMEENLPDWLKNDTASYACRLLDNPDPDIACWCPYHSLLWDAALLPISIIMYIAIAPVRELDQSWQPSRRIGTGSSAREKKGHYQLAPIKKFYFKKRLQRYETGEGGELAVPHFVRGHDRRSHERHLRGGRVTQVKEAWVNPHWVGDSFNELPPHYSLNWFKDERIESAKALIQKEERNHDSN